MKRKNVCVLMATIVFLCVLTACGIDKTTIENVKPELSQVQAICNLATLECYYHTVGKVVKNKTDDQQIIDFLKRDRTVWVEYTGVAQIGIDMTEVKIETSGDSVKITMPDAKILSKWVEPDSYNEDSFYISEDDWLVKNSVTADLQTQAVDKGQEEMKESILSNKSLMKNAQIRAQKLIKNYIDKIGETAGVDYQITWVYEDGTTSTQIQENEENIAEK